MVNKVCVIGGGVVGVSTALLALEKVPDIEVTLVSEKFSPYTTGDGSAGFIFPYLQGKTPDEKMKFWCEKTMQFFQEIAMSSDANEYGIGLLPTYKLYTEVKEVPSFMETFPHWRPVCSKELALFPSRYKFGIFLITYFVECTKLLPMLLKKIVRLGGKVIKEKVKSFEQLQGKYDVVINCAGLGAAELISDTALTPIRGQVIRIQAPWIKFAVMDEEHYILPNSDEIICGGTSQQGDWNLEVNSDDRKKIWKGCSELIPSIKNAKIVREWVGLRPGRFAPRLEREQIKTDKGQMEVIHNYGHGGSGVTIGWGCAHDVIAILEDALTDINLKKIVSNL